jgi:ribonuclease J
MLRPKAEDASTLEKVESPSPSPRSLRPPRPGPSTLRLVALGGLGEIGMNCLAIEQDDGIVLIDCGVTFPTNDLGIDVYHPRFDYLVPRSDRLRGVVLTHGHEDHIGALPYLLAAFEVPVFGPAHAIELARLRLSEHGFNVGETDLSVVQVGRSFDLGPFGFEPIRVTHSIVDATALAIRTVAGTVLHTGDFKFDPAPPDGELTDEARLHALGDEGVRLLLSDSTNIDSPGTAGSEREVAEALSELVHKAKARVVLGVFASNVQRLRVVGDIAVAAGRRLCLLGRSVVNHSRAAQAVGRLGWPSDLVVPSEVAAAMPRERILVVASGTQAERMSTLTRLAMSTHPALRLDQGDLVILSSRIIPGNDRPVYEMMGNFLRLGVELVTRITDRRVHASGHAHRDEQLRMIELTRPRAFVPVHGTLHHLMRHAALARDAGVSEVLVAEDGEAFELSRDTPPVKIARVPVGKVATFGGDELSEEVLRERAQLGRCGVAFVSVLLDRRGALVNTPQVSARGVVDLSLTSALRKAAGAVARAISESDARTRATDSDLSDLVRLAARRAIESLTGRRPVVVVTVSRV